MVENSLSMLLSFYVPHMVLFFSFLVLTHNNKMEWLKGSIGI